jgi:hypothetical protein
MKMGDNILKLHDDQTEIIDLDLDTLVRKTLRDGVKFARQTKGMKRENIARQMSKISGEHITEHILNKWTRNDGGAKFPLSMAEYWIKVTGHDELAVIIPLRLGMKVLRGRELKLYEYFQLKELEERAGAKRKTLEKELMG